MNAAIALASGALVDLTGQPFVRGGRGPVGFDCWGLVLEARRRLGLPLPPDFASAEFTRADVLAAFRGERPAGWMRAPELVTGAVVLAREAGHAGVLLAGRVLHAQARTGAVAWTLGHWTATFGDLECWTCPPTSSSC